MKIKRRTFYLIRKWIAISSIGIIFFGGIYFYTQTEFFTITSYSVRVDGKEAEKHIDIELQEEAKKKSFLIIPRDKIFTYSKSAIISTMRKNIPDLATIEIHSSGLHTVEIEITRLTPAFRIGATKALTEDGIIFTPVSDVTFYPLILLASSTEEVVMIDGLLFTQVSLDGERVDTAFLNDLLSMSTKVSSLIFPVTTIFVETNGDVTLSNADNASSIFFSRKGDQKKIWATLVSAIDTDPLKSKLSSNRNGLQYLDVRYGNKVFYRFNDMSFQNRKGTAIIDSHATTTEANSSSTSTQQ